MMIFPKFFQAPQGFQKNIICHAMQCILYKIYFWKVFHVYYKLICILYALLCGQNFILVKSGCYKPTPLRRISPRDSGSAQEQFRIICSELFFVFPCSFVLSVVTRSATSKILIGLSLQVKSPPRSSSSIGSCSSGTRKHFLCCDTWNTSCTSDN